MRMITLALAAAAVMLAGQARPASAQTYPQYYECKASPCQVAIVSAGKVSGQCTMVVDRDPVHVIKVKPVEMIWTAPSGWQFCRHLGGGVFLKPNQQDDGQFEDLAGGTFDGKFLASTGNCTPAFRLKNKNTVGRTYYYKVILHNAKGEPCEWDPSIVNYP